jgi:hypothetical protein
MSQKELNLKSIMDRLIAGSLLEREASELAHISVRQIRRIKQRYLRDGDAWLIHKARWKTSNHKHDATKYDEAVSIIQKQYQDYSYVLMQEKLAEKHQIVLSMPTLRLELIRRGIRIAKKQRKPDTQRTMRERKACYGEMIQYDGTYHRWFEDRGWEACLLVSVDDATGAVVAKFDVNEGLRATFEFWMEYIHVYGKPKSMYLDRFATYKINHPNATDDKELITQFGRVCKELGIELIFANSPEAKGRVERMNGTLQDRLLKELREQNIPTITEANVFLKEFLPKFNQKFRVEARESSNLHIALRDDENGWLDVIFSEQKVRKVQNDYTIRFENKIIQLYRDKEGGSLVYKKEQVTVEKRMNGSIHVLNKNGKYIISKELDYLPRKSCILPLPPIIWEDEQVVKELIMQENRALKERQAQSMLDRGKERSEKRHAESKARQMYYRGLRKSIQNEVLNPQMVSS